MGTKGKFPTWLGADIIIPEIIRGNVAPHCSFDYRSKKMRIYLLDISDKEHLIPEEIIQDFINEVLKTQVKVFDIIGLDLDRMFSNYMDKPIGDSLMWEIKADMQDHIDKYEIKTGDLVENLFIELLGVNPQRAFNWKKP